MSTLNSYFICATPRTGSTLLCSLLKSSGVAGYPESYFRIEDKAKWANSWGITFSDKEIPYCQNFLQACRKNGQTPNGVYGARIMWGSMEELIESITYALDLPQENDVSILQQFFGNSRFIYLKRKDFVPQAVSRYKAEQTDIWHITGQSTSISVEDKLEYSYEDIKKYVDEAKAHNEKWQAWFDLNGIAPYIIYYEDLAESPVSEVLKILAFLDISFTEPDKISANNKRMSDSLNQNWIEQFKRDQAKRA